VWRLFPGKTYRFLREFQDNQVAFLDFPGLLLPHGAFNAEGPDADAIVLAAQERRKWAADMFAFNRRSDPGDPPQEPSRCLEDYRQEVLPKKFLSDKAALGAFFGAAGKGDLIVVPDRISSRRILIGELLEGPDHRIVATAPDWYGSESIPARPVRWFPVVNELELPEELSDVLRRPNPFTLLSRIFYPEIFDQTYGTYQFGEAQAARLTTSAPDFTSSDNLDLSLLVQMVAVLLYSAEHDQGPFEHFGQVLDFSVPADLIASLAISIHSPGAFHIKASGLLPLAFAAMFALLSTAEAAERPRPEDVSVVNSAEQGALNPCADVIDEKVRTIVRLMGHDLWKAACERAHRLTQNSQMHGDSRATQKRK
jgi:hypothetical protein